MPDAASVPYRERAEEIQREFFEDARRVGIKAAVWNLARAVAIMEAETADAAGVPNV